ncbi:SRPBCC domain-containing protein [Lentibacter algarum]|uniref:SRPBCC family protein n=1 Tax=Lentibacter algarum TaxID=576131 RepID=UPI001C06F0EF|nr:SRPBCC domain-containing protein [Lentibacter algarum]MBU2981857.1 SRPBCC domain-containing protein [Lentibacter algarum]
MSNSTIKKSVFLTASQADVWAHLTKADLLGKWFHPAKEDLSLGKDFTLVSAKDGERMCFGSVQEETPMSYLKWAFSVGPLNGAMTTVEWNLEETTGGTRLSLTHTGLPDTAEGYGLLHALDKGWHGFLANLLNL